MQLGKLREKIMATTSTPKTISELKSQDWVIDLKPTDTPQAAAEEVFNGLFPDDDRHVYVRLLFTENGIRVHEAFKDSGSDDYLYIKETI